MFDLLISDPNEFRQEAARARAALRSDPHRPQYHFTAPYHWLNDPNGLIQWQGQYHLFYQHNPYTPLSATKHWGHAISPDLVHWEDLPIALAPGPDAYDAGGIYSGTAVDDNGVPTIIYTGIDGLHQRVCVATGDDHLLHWRKSDSNPVIPAPPPGLKILRTPDGTRHYRDPSVWWENDKWWMVIGSGIEDVGGTVFLYRSADLRTWEYVQPILTGDIHEREPIWTGSMWECPQLFRLGDRHVLLVSIWHQRRTLYPAYMTGTFRDGRFDPEHVAILDSGSHYAPQTFRDDQGRRILFGWLREQRSPEAMATSGWNGAMSIPWVLEPGDDACLRFSVPPELQSLRSDHRPLTGLRVDANQTVVVPDVQGDSLELQATINPENTTATGLALRRSPDGEEETRVVFDQGSSRLWIDKNASSMDEQADHTSHEMPLELGTNERLHLTVFLDRSVIEVLANGRTLLSTRVYPTRHDSLGVAAFAEGAPAEVERLESWNMRGIWIDG